MARLRDATVGTIRKGTARMSVRAISVIFASVLCLFLRTRAEGRAVRACVASDAGKWLTLAMTNLRVIKALGIVSVCACFEAAYYCAAVSRHSAVAAALALAGYAAFIAFRAMIGSVYVRTLARSHAAAARKLREAFIVETMVSAGAIGGCMLALSARALH